jgi:hypothetical protein
MKWCSAATCASARGSDGQIILTVPYVEMGQGTYTSIPMLSSGAAVRSQLGRRPRPSCLSIDRC